MKHTITIKEIQNMINNGISTFMKKDNSPRGCECVSRNQKKKAENSTFSKIFIKYTLSIV